MEKTPKYAVDTCSFTMLKRVYPPDVVPGAWEAISEMADTGIIISSQEIFLELQAQDDGIYEWACNHKDIFIPLEEQIQRKAMEILRTYPKIIDIKQSKSSADPFLIATALVKSCSVVTEEKPTGPGSKTVKIPNVCRSLQVDCVCLLDVLRFEGVRLEMKRRELN
jgi:hypothetical protein